MLPICTAANFYDLDVPGRGNLRHVFPETPVTARPHGSRLKNCCSALGRLMAQSGGSDRSDECLLSGKNIFTSLSYGVR
jgi:hypothetical protein